jgi:hypothetical protein
LHDKENESLPKRIFQPDWDSQKIEPDHFLLTVAALAAVVYRSLKGVDAAAGRAGNPQSLHFRIAQWILSYKNDVSHSADVQVE